MNICFIILTNEIHFQKILIFFFQKPEKEIGENLRNDYFKHFKKTLNIKSKGFRAMIN